MNAASPGNSPYLLAPLACRQTAESRRMILAAAQTAAPGQALVLGAGRASEIPLAELAARFERLVINDVRAEELAAGLAAAGLAAPGLIAPGFVAPDMHQASAGPSPGARLDLDHSDLTGITAPLVAECEAVLLNAAEVSLACGRLAELFDRWPDGHMTLAGEFDLIVASCLLSQLHFGLAQQVMQQFERRFAGQSETLRTDPAWSAALFRRARRMEAGLIGDIRERLTPAGWLYLSESVQMCHFDVMPDGRWQTPGSYRMLASKNLADCLDSRFAVVSRGNWPWVVWLDAAQTRGRLFDVQGLVARPA